ncbi:hypothetical protein CDEF62S_02225 [Castellaniella defragrans]
MTLEKSSRYRPRHRHGRTRRRQREVVRRPCFRQSVRSQGNGRRRRPRHQPGTTVRLRIFGLLPGRPELVAGKESVKLPDSTKIDGSVSFGPIPTGFSIAVELKISALGVDHAKLQDLVKKAHVVCPYSNATRNNVDVKLTVL